MNEEATLLFVPKKAPSISPGTLLLGTYAVDRALATGGMANTYLTHHRELNNIKQVIKVIKSEFTSDLANAYELTNSEAGEKSIAILRQEAEALLSIHHDAVVGFQGFQKDTEHGHCLIMEYVEGPSLKEHLSQHKLTIPQFWQLRNRLAGGLAAAHAKGIFHRDISPDNVILPDGKIEEAKLIDFGIAKLLNPASNNTVFGSVFVGKFAYAAPEQFEGGTVGAYSDIYSLGLVLAEALIGKRLEMGNSEHTAKNARRSLPDLSLIPTPLRPQIKAMLQPNILDRPRSMSALLQNWPHQPSATRWKGQFIAAGIAISLAIGFWLSASKPGFLPRIPEQTLDINPPTPLEQPKTIETPVVAIPTPAPKINEPVAPEPPIEVPPVKMPDKLESGEQKVVTPKPPVKKPKPRSAPADKLLPVIRPIPKNPKKQNPGKKSVSTSSPEPMSLSPKKPAQKQAGSKCAALREKESYDGEMGFARLTQSDKSYLNSQCP